MIRITFSIAWTMCVGLLPLMIAGADNSDGVLTAIIAAGFLFPLVALLLGISIPAFRHTWHFLLARIADLSGAIRGERPDLDDP